MYWSETCRLSRPPSIHITSTRTAHARERPGRTLDLQLYVPWSPFTDYAKPQVAATWLRGARPIMLSPWTSQVCCTTRVYTGTGVFQQDRFDCHMANHCSFEKFRTADGFTKNRGMNSGPGISVMFSAIPTPLYKLTSYSITRNVCKLYTCLDHFAMSQFGPGLCKS